MLDLKCFIHNKSNLRRDVGGKLDLALLRQDHDDWLTPMFERTDLPYNTSENQPKGTVCTSLAVKCFRTRYIE